MKRYIKSLFLMIVVIGFFVVGKNVYAFDNDQTLSVNAVNVVIAPPSGLGDPFTTPVNWTSMTQNYIYGIRTPTGTRNTYVRALQGSVTSAYQPNKSYTIEVAIKHGYQLYSGDTPNTQGKIYNPYCDVQVSQGALSNVSCQIEQNTYIYDNTYYDRLSFYFTTSNNTYSNVIYTWQFGELNVTDYIYVNLRTTGDENENNWIAWDNIYMGYDNEDTTNGIGGKVDRIGGQLTQQNSILGKIRQKLDEFKDNFDSKMNTLISNVQSILQNMGQDISGLVQDIKSGVNGILQFISSNVLGLDDIDDTLQEFIDDFDDNQILSEIHSFLETPISMLEYIKNPSINPCVNKSFTIFNKNVTIPSGCFFWERQDVQTFREFWNILFGGAIIVSLGLKYFKVIHNATDPYKDDFLGGLDI